MRKQIYGQSIQKMVIKIGSSLLVSDDSLDKALVRSLAKQVATLKESGIDVVIVSSGAIGCGAQILGQDRNQLTLPESQAAAAVGQSRLMRLYDDVFAKHDVLTAQVLVTREDLHDRLRYLNASNTLATLLKQGVVPIINENDTVSVDEIKFGDNDTLGALVTHLVHADVLVILSDVDGLKNYDNDSVVSVVETIDASIEALVKPETSTLGTGGMQSKLDAARMVCKAGEMMVIAPGYTKNILLRLFEEEGLGTIFCPAKSKLALRKRWIAFAGRSRGAIHIDEGAFKALRDKGRSLLPSGVLDVKDGFSKGDVVSVFHQNELLGKGLVNYDASEVLQIKGLKTKDIVKTLGSKSYDAVIHRDNLVLE